MRSQVNQVGWGGVDLFISHVQELQGMVAGGGGISSRAISSIIKLRGDKATTSSAAGQGAAASGM